MSRHTGIDPKEEQIDIEELSLADKKYVDEKDNLRLELSGGQKSGPLSLGDGRLWDIALPTLDTNAANKKYVDDKVADQASRITTLTSTVDDKISDVVDENFNAGADSQIRVVSNIVNAHQNNLLNSEKHLHLSYSGQATGFSTTGGKTVLVWGGFNQIDGRATFCSIHLCGMGWRPITKIQIFASDNTTGLSYASTPITAALTGNFLNGTYIVPVRAHNHFSNMTYLAVYFEGDNRRTTMYFDLYIDLAIE